jgi:hypothetical protein
MINIVDPPNDKIAENKCDILVRDEFRTYSLLNVIG